MSGMIVTTGDLSRPYEVLGIVSDVAYSSGGFWDNDDAFNYFTETQKRIEKKAEKLGADAVICFRQNICGVESIAYVYSYGTAVKFK